MAKFAVACGNVDRGMWQSLQWHVAKFSVACGNVDGGMWQSLQWHVAMLTLACGKFSVACGNVDRGRWQVCSQTLEFSEKNEILNRYRVTQGKSYNRTKATAKRNNGFRLVLSEIYYWSICICFVSGVLEHIKFLQYTVKFR